LGNDVLSPFRIIGKIGLQVIRKEKYFQKAEHDKQLYQDDGPQNPAEVHASKTVNI
jgi:hypothetical protein